MNAQRSICYAVVVACLMVSPVAAQDWKNYTPLPDQINIEPPDSSIQPKVAKLSGVWQGQLKWTGTQGTTSATIVIEKITPDGVSAIWSWGTWGPRSRMQPGWARARGIVKDEGIVLTVGKEPELVTIGLTIRDEKTALAEYTKGGAYSKGVFEKKQ